MISYLQVEGLTKSYGDRLLFSDIVFGVFQGDKIGLVAKNGTGKSTLLKIIAGLESPDSGNVIFKSGIKIGYLGQDFDMDPLKTILENICEVGDREAAKKMLTQLDVPIDRNIKEMSGGELKRAAIVRAIVSDPDMLILDEPTNHLDIKIIEWLEKYLATKKTTLLMVTHDRYFLDNVCNKIIEIDDGQIFVYEGNYNYYIQKRGERYENMSAERAKILNTLRKEQEWMRHQPQARGSKAKYRIDNFYELKEKSKLNLNDKKIDLCSDKVRIGSKIFEAKGICKSFGDKIILKDWSYDFARYEKIGIVGENGVGKSTFIKMLLGEIEPDSGSFDVGQTVKWGYYRQEGGFDLEASKKVIDAVRDISETVRIGDNETLSASAFLSRFLFSAKDQQKYISKLSGGERRRLYLATVLMRNPNFLIFDEPTNDLDIQTLAILEEYLINFKGCVIIISHDRFFLDRIVDHLFVFKGNGAVKDFPGNYSEYRHCLDVAQKEQQIRNNTKTSDKNPTLKPKTEKRGLSYKEKKEKEILEARLSELEKQKNIIETDMSSGTLSNDMLLEYGNQISRIIAEIEESEMRILELMDKE